MQIDEKPTIKEIPNVKNGNGKFQDSQSTFLMEDSTSSLAYVFFIQFRECKMLKYSC